MTDPTATADYSSAFARVPNLRPRGDFLEGGDCQLCGSLRSFSITKNGIWRCSICGLGGDLAKFEALLAALEGPEQPQVQQDPEPTPSPHSSTPPPDLQKSKPTKNRSSVPVPFVLDLESSIIGELILESKIPGEIIGELAPNLFSEHWRPTVQAIISVYEKTGACDFALVGEELNRMHGGGIDATLDLIRLAEMVTSSVNLAAHVKQLKARAAESEEEPEKELSGLTFPDSAWRGPFEAYRKAMDGTSEAPGPVHFSSLWAIAAARLRRRVHTYYAFPHFPNVFIVNYGLTGESKTSAMRQGLRNLPDDGRVKVLRGVGSAEALGDWMRQPDDGPRVSHLIFLEELAGLLTRGSWEGSTLLHFLTETFDCPPVYEVPFRKNPIRVDEPTPTLIAGTTPEWFWKSMREIDFHGGFGNRILFLTGPPKAPIPMPAKPNQVLLGEVQVALDGLERGFQGETSLAPSALTLWQDFYMAWKRTEWDPLTTAAIKRTPAYILKLAMVYACFEHTAPTITVEQLTAAIEVGNYAARCTEQLIGQQRQHTVQGRCEQRILKILKREDLPPWRIHRRIGGQSSAKEIDMALRALLATGVIREVGRTVRKEPVYGRRSRLRS